MLSALISGFCSVFVKQSTSAHYRGILGFSHIVTINGSRNRRPAHISGPDSILGTPKEDYRKVILSLNDIE